MHLGKREIEQNIQNKVVLSNFKEKVSAKCTKEMQK